MSEQNNVFIPLWARLGVSLSATPEEVEILRRQDDFAKQLLVSLIRSDRCVLDGETYFPDPVNEPYLPGDVEFNLSPTSLHDNEHRKPSLNDQILASEARASSLQKDNPKNITSSLQER